MRAGSEAEGIDDLEAAAAQYRDMLGAKVGAPQDEPDHGVTVIFIELPNTKIELLYPLGENSPIQGFLDKNPSGGIHHVCYEVDDIIEARDHLKSTGARVLGTPAAPIKTALRAFEAAGLSPLYEWVYGTADKDSYVSVEKARQKLGWEPQYSNADALIRSYQWYIDNKSTITQGTGVTHRIAWDQGILRVFKAFL